MLKKLDPNATFKLVSTMDGAIDEQKSDIDAYRKSHNLKHLKFKEGHKPTYFIAKPLTAMKRAELESEHQELIMPEVKEGKPKGSPTIKLKNWSVLMVKVFSECVTKVEDDGVISDCTPDHYGSAVVGEVGAFVFNRGNLSDEEKKS